MKVVNLSGDLMVVDILSPLVLMAKQACSPIDLCAITSTELEMEPGKICSLRREPSPV